MIHDYGQSELPAGYNGPTWSTEELQRDFEVLGFSAPWVVVKRKSDGQKGALEFIHRPRIYFGWKEAS